MWQRKINIDKELRMSALRSNENFIRQTNLSKGLEASFSAKYSYL